MSIKKHFFLNSKNEKLIARLQLPIDKKPKAYALFAHCFTCNKNLMAIKNISIELTRHGFGVFRFDFTGLGESEGDFKDTNFSSNINDLIAAAAYLEHQFEAPKLIVGHSLGGAASVFAASKIQSIKALVTIGSPSSPKHVEHLFKENIHEIKQNGESSVEIGGRSFIIQNQFLEDISEKNLSTLLKNLRKPVLIMHSPDDTTVPINNASELYSYAKHPKSFISLDGADHLLSSSTDSIYVGEVIGSWASRYIPNKTNKSLKTKQHVLVQTGKESFTTDIIAGKHTLRADEPESVGGNNFGPTPYDLLLASIGACTSMTLKMYADMKKWDVEEINVHLSHEKDYTKDSKECETSETKIDHIERFISFKGNLDKKQLERLLQIADKCPVHKTLHNQVIIKTSLLE